MKMILTADRLVDKGEDLTPPLRPLAAVLSHSNLLTHCSACFGPLDRLRRYPVCERVNVEAPLYFAPPNHPDAHYCSAACAARDSPLHVNSGGHILLFLRPEYGPNALCHTTPLRLALRLAHIFETLPPGVGRLATNRPERIMGLLTNREQLGLEDWIQDGARLMDHARQLRNGVTYENFDWNQHGVRVMNDARRARIRPLFQWPFPLTEMFLCSVMTNAVVVIDKTGKYLGSAVYGFNYSWINHSCSPNSCHRFLVGADVGEQMLTEQIISPVPESGISPQLRLIHGQGYGPRIVVRNLKNLVPGDEVTVAYWDTVLHTKRVRHEKLWSRYRFNCRCERCSNLEHKVDQALQALMADHPENPRFSDDEIKMVVPLADFNYVKNFNLDVGIIKPVTYPPAVCYRTFECLLCYGKFRDASTVPPQMKKLHPTNRHCLDAYQILAVAHKLLSTSAMVQGNRPQGLGYRKKSAAYSLLLAGVVNNLFMSEPGIIADAGVYWKTAGKFLIMFVKSAMVTYGFLLFDPSLLTLPRCDECSVVNGEEPMQMEDMKSELYSCIASISSRVWDYLSLSGSGFLKYIVDPVDLRWLRNAEADGLVGRADPLFEDFLDEETATDLYMLGIHCLKYGALLWSACYGSTFEATYAEALEDATRIRLY